MYGQNQAPSANVAGANNRIVIGVIGTGNQGSTHIRLNKKTAAENNIKIGAVCDLYQKRLDQAQTTAEVASTEAFRDHRKLLERKDIDAVICAPVDNWHAQVSIDGAGTSTWSASTIDRRGLQKVNGTGRIAATWFADTSFSIDVTITDGRRHAVALYLVDWDGFERTQTIEVIDAATGQVLDTGTTGFFADGRYMVWEVSQRVRFRITNTGRPNATISGIFFTCM